MYHKDWSSKGFWFCSLGIPKRTALSFKVPYVVYHLVYGTHHFCYLQSECKWPARRGLWWGERTQARRPVVSTAICLIHEYFTRLMKLAGEHPHFKFHLTCRQNKLNHLMFADDVIIFSKAHLPTLQIIKNNLEKFYQVAGLKANQDKSQLVCGGCTSLLQQQCVDLIGGLCQWDTLGFLSLPASSASLSGILWWRR